MPRVRLIDRIAKEGALCVGHSESGVSFYLPSGRRVRREQAERLIASGRLRAQMDGLLPDIPQSYVIAAGA